VEQLDERGDVFGLGAILCVILTGQPPWRGTSREEVQAQAAEGELSDVLARLESSRADEELLQLARRCLAVDPTDRPPTPAKVLRAVANYRSRAFHRTRDADGSAPPPRHAPSRPAPRSGSNGGGGVCSWGWRWC